MRDIEIERDLLDLTCSFHHEMNNFDLSYYEGQRFVPGVLELWLLIIIVI